MWFLIVAIIILIFCIWAAIYDDNDLAGLMIILGACIMGLTMLGISELVENTDYKQGQIDALNGKYKYKRLIQYEFIDNTYIPVDTIYVEIK